MNLKYLFLILVVVIFLGGCVGKTPTIDILQCSPFFVYGQQADGHPYIDVEQSSCFCRMYRYSKEYMGPIAETSPRPIGECNKLVGNKPQDYANLSTYLENLRRKLNGNP